LPEAAAKREVALLTDALKVPGNNGDRVADAWLAISDVEKANPANAARLTPDVRQALLEGVATPRTGDELGTAGGLGVKQVREAAEGLLRMQDEPARQIEQMIARAGTGQAASPRADAVTERALLLKGLAARADRFDPARDKLPETGSNRRAAMWELTDFA